MTFEHNFDCRPGRGSRLMSRLLRKIFGISRLSRPNLGMSRLWRPKSSISRFATMMIRRDYCDRSGDCATKTSRLIFGTSRLSRPRVALSRLSRHRWRRRDFPDQHEDGATFKKSFSGLSRPRWRRHDFRDHGGYGATQETARLKKQRRDRLGQCDQKVHFQDFRDRHTKIWSRKSRHGFRDPCPDFRDQILVCTDFDGPRRDSCPNFPDSRRDYAIWV